MNTTCDDEEFGSGYSTVECIYDTTWFVFLVALCGIVVAFIIVMSIITMQRRWCSRRCRRSSPSVYSDIYDDINGTYTLRSTIPLARSNSNIANETSHDAEVGTSPISNSSQTNEVMLQFDTSAINPTYASTAKRPSDSGQSDIAIALSADLSQSQIQPELNLHVPVYHNVTSDASRDRSATAPLVGSTRDSAGYSTIDESQVKSIKPQDDTVYSYATEHGLIALLGEKKVRANTADRIIDRKQSDSSNASYVNTSTDTDRVIDRKPSDGANVSYMNISTEHLEKGHDTGKKVTPQDKFDLIAQLLQRNRMYENANVTNLPDSGYTPIDPNSISQGATYTGLLPQQKSDISVKDNSNNDKKNNNNHHYENRAMWLHRNDSCDSEESKSEESESSIYI